MPDLVRASDLFVHPSHEEGFSNAILEAMAGGKAVVAYDVGGNPEAVRQEELFSIKRMVRETETLYESLAERKR